MATPPSIKRKRHDLSDTITVSAGAGEISKTFVVHHSFATKSSKYIKSALKNDWKEGQERQISLADHEPETLEGYINWLYTEEVTLKDAEEKCSHHGLGATQQFQDSYCSHMQCLKVVKMYTLGDYLNDMRFCNAVIDAMETMQGCVPGPDAISWVWGHMMQDCPVRKCVLEKWAGVLGASAPSSIDFMRGNSSKIPKDFLFDLLAHMEARHCSKTAKHAKEKSTLADMCKFHKHVDDSDKCGDKQLFR